MGLLDNAGTIVGTLGTIAGWAGVGEGRQDRRQIAQQGKLNEVNEASNRRSAGYEQALKLQMWKDTNYKAQLEQAEIAGVSKAAAIGGGTGGAQGASVSSVGSGSAADAASTSNARTSSIGMGMQLASQIALQNAQKENIEADTVNKKAETGVKVASTGSINEDVKGKQWENEVKKMMGTEGEVAARDKANESKVVSGEKNNAEWEALKAAAFDGKTFNDKSNPMVKAIRAGYEQVSQALKNSKATGDVTKAQAIIEGFKANLAEQGIAPDSPWYVKILGDLLAKVGMNPLSGVKTVIKSVKNN